jgi:nucleoside-diphosphate-sugar epimerase
MSGSTLVVGPGWLGAPAAAVLAQGETATVFTLSRSGREAPQGCTAVAGDITRGSDDHALLQALPATVAQIVVCVAPSSARGDRYDLYPAAARGAVQLAEALHTRALVYVSSTGIYDRQDGSEVDERTLIMPTNDRVQALMDAELAVLSAATPTRAVTVLRAAGLYGPGRDPQRRFAAALTPPDTWCNFSWRDDVIAAMAHVLAQPATGRGALYNCTDNSPVQAGAITHALTGAWPLPDTSSPGEAAQGGAVRSGRSNQRVCSAALLRTGFMPQVRDIFEGLRRLGHALPGLETRS